MHATTRVATSSNIDSNNNNKLTRIFDRIAAARKKCSICNHRWHAQCTLHTGHPNARVGNALSDTHFRMRIAHCNLDSNSSINDRTSKRNTIQKMHVKYIANAKIASKCIGTHVWVSVREWPSNARVIKCKWFSNAFRNGMRSDGGEVSGSTNRCRCVRRDNRFRVSSQNKTNDYISERTHTHRAMPVSYCYFKQRTPVAAATTNTHDDSAWSVRVCVCVSVCRHAYIREWTQSTERGCAAIVKCIRKCMPTIAVLYGQHSCRCIGVCQCVRCRSLLSLRLVSPFMCGR